MLKQSVVQRKKEVLQIAILGLLKYLLISGHLRTDSDVGRFRVGTVRCLHLPQTVHVQEIGVRRKRAHRLPYPRPERTTNRPDDLQRNNTNQQDVESMHRVGQQHGALLQGARDGSQVRKQVRANPRPQVQRELSYPNRPCLTSCVVIENHCACGRH